MCFKVPDDDCTICLEPLTKYMNFKTKCNHYFHYKCFRHVKTQQYKFSIDFDDGTDIELEEGARIKKCPMCRTLVNFDYGQQLIV